ncbi:MAG: hypothetical protein GY711_25800 [bacterium]|nr:hypothetical protein [bacterium]
MQSSQPLLISTALALLGPFLASCASVGSRRPIVSASTVVDAKASLFAPDMGQDDARAPADPATFLKTEDLARPGEPQEGDPMAPSKRPPSQLSRDGAMYVTTSDPKHPLVRYKDGQLSLNDSCAVLRGNKLNRRMPPAYVNGQPLGFC